MENRKRLKIFLQITAVVVGIALVYMGLTFIERRQGDKLAEAHREDAEKEESQSVLQQATIWLGDEQYTFSHDVKTYLIMGTDESGNEEGTGSEYRGSMADCIFVLMIDINAKKYGIIQLNRDTITDMVMLWWDGTDQYTTKTQLCTAHWYGANKKESCENTVDAVSGLLGGLPFDGYYAMKIEAMPVLNHAVGGVTLTLEESLTEIDSSMVEGATIHMTDEQAAKYVRTRLEVGDGENTSRMRRQRVFMSAFMDALKTNVSADAKFVIKLMDELQPYVTTDIGGKVISEFAQDIDEYEYIGLQTPDGRLTVGDTDGNGKLYTEFYVDESSLWGILKNMYPLVPVEMDSITAGDE